MSNTSYRKACAIGEHHPAVFQCHGCQQFFCWQHTQSHREKINDEFNELEGKHRNVQRMFSERQGFQLEGMDHLYNQMIIGIDHWERTSIEKIQEMAQKRRDELMQYTKEHWKYLKDHLEKVHREMDEARIRSAVIETDLKQWTFQLDQLKEQLFTLPTLVLQPHSTPLVETIELFNMNDNDSFSRGTSNVQIDENGSVVSIGAGSDIYTDVRGKKEYRSGHHLLRIKAEKLQGWSLFGIINASEPLQIHSYNARSCYGWYNGHGFVYAGGEIQDGQGHDLVDNDIGLLVIDCDQRIIRLINERTKHQLQIDVDLNRCPFPWQLHLNLNMTPTRIRILPSNQ